MTDYLLVLDQKIPYWSIKIMFLGEIKLQLDQMLSLSLASWASSMSDAILSLWFSL